MKNTIITIAAISGLILTILPALLVFSGIINNSLNKSIMFLGMIIWFTASPYWIKK